MALDKNIAIIGGGNLGSSIAQGLINANAVEASKITITRRRIHLLDELKQKGVNTIEDNIQAIKKSEIIIISVKPHQVSDLIAEIKPHLDEKKHIVISVVTGITIKEFNDLLGDIPFARAMPNTATALNESMTCLAFDEQNKVLEPLLIEMFDHLGQAVVIREELMGAATVIGACGVAFALRFMRAFSQGGIEIGFGAELSQLITAQTIKGAAKLILESGNHPEKEIDKVTTPMGVTISGLNEMEHEGFSPAVIKGILTSYNKLQSIDSKKKTKK